MKKSAAFFHTTMNTPRPLAEAFHQRFPGAPLISVMDDSILPEVITNNGCYTRRIVRKLIAFGEEAARCGASVALCMCTTLNQAVAEAAPYLDIPFLTIDGPMLNQAVRVGSRIALLITASTTRTASGRAIRAAAIQAGKPEISIDTILVEGAFDALNHAHDKKLHDHLIAECARNAAGTHDVIALAQVSMADVSRDLADLNIPVLTSLDSGIGQLAAFLDSKKQEDFI